MGKPHRRARRATIFAVVIAVVAGATLPAARAVDLDAPRMRTVVVNQELFAKYRGRSALVSDEALDFRPVSGDQFRWIERHVAMPAQGRGLRVVMNSTAGLLVADLVTDDTTGESRTWTYLVAPTRGAVETVAKSHAWVDGAQVRAEADGGGNELRSGRPVTAADAPKCLGCAVLGTAAGAAVGVACVVAGVGGGIPGLLCVGIAAILGLGAGEACVLTACPDNTDAGFVVRSFNCNVDYVSCEFHLDARNGSNRQLRSIGSTIIWEYAAGYGDRDDGGTASEHIDSATDIPPIPGGLSVGYQGYAHRHESNLPRWAKCASEATFAITLQWSDWSFISTGWVGPVPKKRLPPPCTGEHLR